jgi:hypothetical protein
MTRLVVSLVMAMGMLTGCANSPIMVAGPAPTGQAGALAAKPRYMSLIKGDVDPNRNKPAAPALQIRLLKAPTSQNTGTDGEVIGIARTALLNMEQASWYVSGNTFGYDVLKLQLIPKLGISDLVARVGYKSANNFISSESAFKVLVVTLDHVANDRPTTGPVSFAAYRTMVEQTTSWADGTKVGYEMLDVLRTDYPDAAIRQMANTAFIQAHRLGVNEGAHKLILRALEEMSNRS